MSRFFIVLDCATWLERITTHVGRPVNHSRLLLGPETLQGRVPQPPIITFAPSSSGKIEQNVISLGFYHIGSNGKCAGDNLTRCHVKLVAMPRTRDYRSIDLSLSQWPAAMSADIVQA
jgi:hypothetical protein